MADNNKQYEVLQKIYKLMKDNMSLREKEEKVVSNISAEEKEITKEKNKQKKIVEDLGKLILDEINFQKNRLKILDSVSEKLETNLDIEEKKVDFLQKITEDTEKELKNRTDILEKNRELLESNTDISLEEKRAIEYELQAQEKILLQDIKSNEEGKKKIKIFQKNNEELNESIVSYQTIGGQTKLFIQSITGISDRWKETIFGKLSLASKQAGGFGVALREMGKSIKEAVSVSNVLGSALMRVQEQSLYFAIEQDEVLSSFKKSTGAGSKYDEVITKIEKQNFHLGVTTAESAQSLKSLREEFTDFNIIGQKSRDEMVAFTSIIGELGVSSEDSAKVFQSLGKIVGDTTEQSNKSFREVLATAKSLDISFGKITQDFTRITPQLAMYGDKMVEKFRKLSTIVKSTGMEMDKMISLSEQFMTFEEGANAVGSLNAVLGGNFLDTMEMMEASIKGPEEVFKLLRQSIEDAGLSFESMGVIQRRAIARAMGLSDVNELAKLLSGNLEKTAMASEEQALSQEDIAKTAAEAQSKQEKYNQTLRMFVVPLRSVVEGMKSFLDKVFSLNNALGGYLVPSVIGLLGVFKIMPFRFGIVTGLFSKLGGAMKIFGSGAMKIFGNAAKVSKSVTGLFSKLGGAMKIFGNAAKDSKSPVQSLNSEITKTTKMSTPLSGTAKNMMAFGSSLVLIGASIWLVSKGISSLSDSFSKLDSKQLSSLVITLGIMSATFLGFSKVMSTFGALAIKPLLVFSGALGLVFSAISLVFYVLTKFVDSITGLVKTSSGLPGIADSIQKIALSLGKIPLMGTIKFSGMLGSVASAVNEMKGTEGVTKNLSGLIKSSQEIKTDTIENTKKLMNEVTRIKEIKEVNNIEQITKLVSTIKTEMGSTASKQETKGIGTIILELDGRVLKKFVIDTLNTSMMPKRI